MVVRAIYEKGKLNLLEPVDLVEGQTVAITIDPVSPPMSELDELKAILGDLVHWADPTDNRHAWVEDMADEIADAFKGLKPLSEIIIEERGEQL